MLFHAEVVAKNEEGALERILRVCRHRGFWAHTLHAITDPTENRLLVEMEGESDRSPLLLTRQLEKLCGVLEVTMGGKRREAAVVAGEHEARGCANQVRRAVYASGSHG
jgi:acetolactate synthase II small subunit